MTASESQYSELFRFFILQQQMAAMIYMGKIVRPDTGHIERNLDAARFAIDLLGMIEEKTKGNLAGEEEQLLQQVVTTLRLSFVDEAKREEAQDGQAPTLADKGEGEPVEPTE